MFSVGRIGFTVLHCTELSGFVLRGSALSCEVSSFPASCHVPGGCESEELPAVCLWGSGMEPTATASSDLMQKAAGSSPIHCSLYMPRLSLSSD